MKLVTIVSPCSEPSKVVAPMRQRVPSMEEWAFRRPEIERLYVCERRKLRFVIQYMERQYGLKATEQMYKKRLAQWGLQKNSRRSADSVPMLARKVTCRKLPRRKNNGGLGSMPASPQLGYLDSLRLGFLTSVRRWSISFFESKYCCDQHVACRLPSPSTAQSWSEKAKQTSFTLKLVDALLDRGHAVLAGKMTRKAFLLVEDLLLLEGPALVWNLLEIMYHMVTRRNEQLFHILLVHLIALINRRMSEAHPLNTLLHQLRGFVATLIIVAHQPGNSSCPSSPSSPRLFNGENAVSALLTEAWVLNAEMVLNHFHPQFFQLYTQLNWESCSITLPSAIVGTVKQWLGLTANNIMDVHHAKDAIANTPVVEADRMLRRLLAPRADASPPHTFEILRASSVATLREQGNRILGMGLTFHNNTTTSLQILPALIKASIVEELATVVRQSSSANIGVSKVSRSEAHNLACVVKALLDLSAERVGERRNALPATIERIRSVVALREYASGETDPQVIWEMWELENGFAATGKAQIVRQTVLRRLEEYTKDIPLNST